MADTRSELLDALVNGDPKIDAMQEMVDRLAEISRKFRAIEEFQRRPEPFPHACGCVGKRYGEPACPCGMAYVVKIDERWYEISKIQVMRGTRYVATRV